MSIKFGLPKQAAPQQGKVSNRIFGFILLAYLLPIALCAYLLWDLGNVNRVKNFIPGHQQDLDIISVLATETTYQQWYNAMRGVIKNPTQQSLDAAATADTAWQAKLADLSATAKQPKWRNLVETSQDARGQVIEKIDQFAIPAIYVESTIERLLTGQGAQIQNQFSRLIEQASDDAATLEVLANGNADFQQMQQQLIMFSRTGSQQAIANIRRLLISLEESINRADNLNSSGGRGQFSALKSSLANLYEEFDSLTANQDELTQLKRALNTPSTNALLIQANPLETTQWKQLSTTLDDSTLESAFSRMHYALITGLIVLLALLSFAAVHLYGQYYKPMQALLSYSTHAFIGRKRQAVPGIDRQDDFGILARSLQAMIERIYANPDLLKNESQETYNRPETETPLSGLRSDRMPSMGDVKQQIISKPPAVNQVGRQYLSNLQEMLREIGGKTNRLNAQNTEHAEIAEKVRAIVQSTAEELQQLTDLAVIVMDKLSATGGAAKQLTDKTAQLQIRSQGAKISGQHLSNAFRALNDLGDEADTLSQNVQLTLSKHNITDADDQAIGAKISNFANNIKEAIAFLQQEEMNFRNQADIAANYAVDANKLADKQAGIYQGLLAITQQLNTDLGRLCSNAQTAGFQTGKLSVAMLDIQAGFIGLSTTLDESIRLSDKISNAQRQETAQPRIPVLEKK